MKKSITPEILEILIQEWVDEYRIIPTVALTYLSDLSAKDLAEYIVGELQYRFKEEK